MATSKSAGVFYICSRHVRHMPKPAAPTAAPTVYGLKEVHGVARSQPGVGHGTGNACQTLGGRKNRLRGPVCNSVDEARVPCCRLAGVVVLANGCFAPILLKKSAAN